MVSLDKRINGDTQHFLGPDYDPSTRVTKKGEIRQPYYNQYVTNGKMV